MWLMTVLKASLSRYRSVNTKKNQFRLYIYRAQNTTINKFNDNLSFMLGNYTSKIEYICGDYNIDLLLCEERALTYFP